MRFILRLFGTWLLGLAVILLIIDGTRSLAANAVVWTAFGESWTAIHPESLDQTRAFLSSRLFGPLLETIVSALLGFPGFVVLGVPGLILAYLGRTRRARVFLRQDQI